MHIFIIQVVILGSFDIVCNTTFRCSTYGVYGVGTIYFASNTTHTINDFTFSYGGVGSPSGSTLAIVGEGTSLYGINMEVTLYQLLLHCFC